MMKKLFFVPTLFAYSFVSAVIKDVPTVSDVPLTSVYFDKTAYAFVDDQAMLFLGAGAPLTASSTTAAQNETNFALARLVEHADSTAKIEPLAPVMVTLNSVKDQANPLLGKKVKQLALYKKAYPVVVPETQEGTAPATSNQFFVVTDVVHGSKMLGIKDNATLKDAAGKDVATVLAGVAGGQEYVFAVVPDATAASFGAVAGVNRGVAVTKQFSEKQEAGTVSFFKQLDPLNFNATDVTPAAFITLTSAEGLVALAEGGGDTFIDAALVGDDASVWWDDTLERLYVGFSDMSRNDDNKEGGVMGLVMGLVDTTANGGKGSAFTLNPIVFEPTKDHFYKNSNLAHDNDAAAYNVIAQRAAANAILTTAADVKKAVTPVGVGTGTFVVRDTDGTALNYAALPAASFLKKSVDAVVAAAPVGGTAAAANLAINNKVTQEVTINRTAAKTAVKQESVNTLDVPLGFYFDAKTPRTSPPPRNVRTAQNNSDDEITLSVGSIRTMHTSAGKPYLIFNGVVGNDPFAVGGFLFGGSIQDRVYAIPLIGDILNEQPETKGSVAKVNAQGVTDYTNNMYNVPTKIAEMPLKAHPAVTVGGKEPVPGAFIEDIFVQGESVFMAMAGFNNKSIGMFQSTAILNELGFIVDWTPAKRVMGSVQKAYGAGLDTTTGQFYFLGTHNDNDPTMAMIPNTGQITTWGKGDVALHGGSEAGLLSTILGENFSSGSGGVHQLFNFDENTPSFYRGRFSMMVAIGSREIGLIETGSFVDGQFAPTAAFAKNTNVDVVSDQLLSAISPLSCAAITQQFNRMASPNADRPDADPATGQSLLFVGGYRGVVRAVVTDPANEGAGLLDVSAGVWDQTNLTDIKGPVIRVATLPDQIYDDAGTRRVRNGALYVLTNTTLYRRNLDGTPNGSLPITRAADLVVARDRNNRDIIFVATSLGLFQSINLGPLQAVAGAGNQEIQLQYLSGNRNGVPSVPGNLYVIARGQRVLDPLVVEQNEKDEIVPPTDIVTQIYRFAVLEDATVAGGIKVGMIDKRGANVTKQVSGPLVQYDDLRSNFATDGALLFNTNPKDLVATDFVRVTSVSATTTQDSVANDTSITDALDLDIEKNFNVGIIVRDSASGAWVVPGDWGVRVNE
ncbi:hypothetical protein K2W90_06250 [Candidatus Babeliales bacterium]|nr:hypothetical protein [Candidatus Babeliales bacterium]